MKVLRMEDPMKRGMKMTMFRRIHSYHWKHLPTGMEGESETDGDMSLSQFQALLIKWNESNPSVWHYEAAE